MELVLLLYTQSSTTDPPTSGFSPNPNIFGQKCPILPIFLEFCIFPDLAQLPIYPGLTTSNGRNIDHMYSQGVLNGTGIAFLHSRLDHGPTHIRFFHRTRTFLVKNAQFFLFFWNSPYFLIWHNFQYIRV